MVRLQASDRDHPPADRVYLSVQFDNGIGLLQLLRAGMGHEGWSPAGATTLDDPLRPAS